MSGGELVLTTFVAIVVFGPNKLPMLAQHLGKLFRYFMQIKQQTQTLWQGQLNEQQLRENNAKAEKGDALYLAQTQNTKEDT